MDTTTTGRAAAGASFFVGTKRARSSPLRITVLLLSHTAVTLRPRLASASTSLPSSSTSELCPDETAACYDSIFCWECVAQFEGSSDFCEERYPILTLDYGASAATADDDSCEAASALFCCSFDASGQDCLGDAVTLDYFQCGLLAGSGCALSILSCSPTYSPDAGQATSAPGAAAVTGSPVTPSPTPPTLIDAAPTASPADEMAATTPSPDSIDDSSSGSDDDPRMSTPSPSGSDLDAGTGATSGTAGIFAALPSYSSALFLWGAAFVVFMGRAGV